MDANHGMRPHYPALSPTATGLAGRCPRCGDGHLFSGFLKVAPRCEACGLDFAFADAGDGPAIFVMLVAGVIVLGGALMIEALWEPPIWVHLLATAPFALIVCLGMLRPLKGVMVALQYRNKAEQGRLSE